MKRTLWLVLGTLVIMPATAVTKIPNNMTTETTVLVPVNNEIKQFVKTVEERYPEKLAHYELNKTILKAALMFDALSAYGIRHQPARTKTDFFLQMAQEDSVYLIPPMTLFTNLRGSAEELAILYASVLEAAGIATGLVNSKKHPLVIFDTGIHKIYSDVVSRNIPAFTILNDHIWFTVEVTKLGKPFFEAWKSTVGKISSRPHIIIPVLEVFQPRNSDIVDTFASGITGAGIAALIEQDKVFFENKDTDAKLKDVTALMQENNKKTVMYFNEGLRYLNSGIDEKAVVAFKKAADVGADLGQVLFLMAKAFGQKKDYSRMKKTGRKLIRFNKRDPRGYKILGLAYYYSGDIFVGEKFMTRANFLDDNLLTVSK
ncbi:MAG: tetratricopeptide repeat protein [bacterium]